MNLSLGHHNSHLSRERRPAPGRGEPLPSRAGQADQSDCSPDASRDRDLGRFSGVLCDGEWARGPVGRALRQVAGLVG